MLKDGVSPSWVGVSDLGFDGRGLVKGVGGTGLQLIFVDAFENDGVFKDALAKEGVSKPVFSKVLEQEVGTSSSPPGKLGRGTSAETDKSSALDKSDFTILGGLCSLEIDSGLSWLVVKRGTPLLWTVYGVFSSSKIDRSTSFELPRYL